MQAKPRAFALDIIIQPSHVRSGFNQDGSRGGCSFVIPPLYLFGGATKRIVLDNLKTRIIMAD